MYLVESVCPFVCVCDSIFKNFWKKKTHGYQSERSMLDHRLDQIGPQGPAQCVCNQGGGVSWMQSISF